MNFKCSTKSNVKYTQIVPITILFMVFDFCKFVFSKHIFGSGCEIKDVSWQLLPFLDMDRHRKMNFDRNS